MTRITLRKLIILVAMLAVAVTMTSCQTTGKFSSMHVEDSVHNSWSDIFVT